MSGWPESPLVDLVDDSIGGLWGSVPESNKSDEVDVLVVRGADFRNWSTRRAADAAPRRIPARALERRQLRLGDLVVEVSGGGPAQPVGRTLVIDEEALAGAVNPLICSNFCRKLRLRPDVNPYFVKLHLDRLYASGHTDRFQTSTTNIRNLQVDDFLNGTPVPLPDATTQAAVADALGQIGELRSRCLRHVTTANQTLARFRQSVLAAACSGRLTADWREAYEQYSAAEELVETSRQRVRAESSRQRSDAAWAAPEWLDLPDTWRWAPMGDLAAIRGGIQKQPKRTPKANHFPYLRVANVLRGCLDLHEIHEFELFPGELETYRLHPGDLLVVEGNGSPTEIGRAALWNGEISDCVHQNHIIRVRSAGLNPEFALLFWNSPVGAREIAALAVTSSGLYSLSTRKIAAVPVPVPPPDEQDEIVRRAAALIGAAEAIGAKVDSAARSVRRTSEACLAKAFRGELTPEHA